MIVESIFGIISGLGGSIATGLLNNRQQKIKNKHELALIKAQTQAMIEETKAEIKVSEIELEKDLQLAEIESFKTSQVVGNRVNVSNEVLQLLLKGRFSRFIGMILAFLLGMVDVIRSLMRPAITIILLWITTYMTYRNVVVVVENKELLSPEHVFELTKSVVYLTFTVIGWWFGDRGFRKINFLK